MKTKEKKLKPAKKTEKGKKYEYTFGLTITKKIENKKENIAEQTEEGRKEFSPYMPKVIAMKLLFFIVIDKDKHLEYISADVCSTNKDFQKENNAIKKFIIDFTAEEAKKMFEVFTIKDKGKTFIVKDDNTIAIRVNANAELEEEKEMKRIRDYPFLYGNKEYSLLDFYKDIKFSLNYELDIRTYAGRKFDFVGFYNYCFKRPILSYFDYTSLLQDRGFYINIDKEKLGEALYKYIELFMEDKLKTFENIYSYKKHLEKIYELFGQMYEDIGKTIIIPCEIEDKKFRVIECFFAMQEQDYVKVDNFIYNEKENKLAIKVTFLKAPKDISEANNSWITYGDLKVNENLSKAIYKGKEIEFKKDVDRFAALCFLIKHPNEYVSFEDLIKATDKLGREYKKFNERVQKEKKEEKYTKLDRFEKAEKNKEYKKEEDSYRKKVSQLTIRVQKRLGIVKDSNRTICIISNKKKGFMLHKK